MLFDWNGYVIPDIMSGTHNPAKVSSLNLFKRLVSNWDRHALEKAMQTAEESMPERIPLSFQFLNQVKHYHCQVFRSGYHFFIGGCEVQYSPVIPLYPRLEIIGG